MNVIEAFEALRNGKKIRKKEWKPKEFLMIIDGDKRFVYHILDGKCSKHIRYSSGFPMDITEINMLDEWEIYEDEPDVKASEKNAKRIKELTEIIRKASDELSDIIGE